MLTQNIKSGHTESLSKLNGGRSAPSDSGFFYARNGQLYPSLVGVENRHTTPARENLYAVSVKPRVRPTARIVGSLSLKFNGGHMTNLSIGAANAPVPFSFESHTVRAVNKDGECWFVAADVGAVLELTNVRASAALLDDDEKGVNTIDTPSGKQEMSIINESGLYALILRSRKPEAKRFRKWVTSEVLPAIRKTGSYTQSITKAQQGELATLIAERFPEGNSRPYAWSRFNNHFRLASYKDLPANRFEEACEYIRDMPVQKKPEDLIREIIGHRRFMLRFDHNGYLDVSLVEPEAFVMSIPQLIENITDSDFFMSDNNIHDLADACLNRLYRKIKAEKETVKRLGQKIKEAAK